MDDEMREAIEWLNSWAGRKWSRQNFKQSSYAIRMFSVKDDAEGDPSLPYRSWGSCDHAGRYHKPASAPG